MKQLFFLSFIIICFTANAANFYLSATGNDANNGTSTSTPWKTLSKLNSVFSSLSPGDNIYFNRGDTFYGTITVNKSGSPGSPITIGAYGTGAMPVISGFKTISAWTNLGNNIWESTSSISKLPYTNLVAVNSVNTPMGRIPNIGSLYQYQSFTNGTTNTITSSRLNSSIINWSGAELALYNTTYAIARNKISSQSGGTLTYTPASTNIAIQGNTQGFIIQNDIRTLDAQNEWYYNPSTKKLDIYSTSSPGNVQIATLDSLVYINGRSFITFDRLSFSGANSEAIYLSTVSNIIIQSCSFNLMGRDAIFSTFNASSNITVQNNIINNCNNDGVNIFFPQNTNVIIRGNIIANCGKWVGMGSSGRLGISPGSPGTYGGIFSTGDNGLIELNNIDSTGNEGVWFKGNNSVAQKNFINHSDLILTDNGALYTWNGDGGTNSGLKILNNIVLNTPDKGIYLDENSNNIEVAGNTVANSHIGFLIHHSWNINLHDNTSYSNSIGYYVSSRGTSYSHSGNSSHKNIWFGKSSTDTLAFFDPIDLILPGLTIDSNYYAMPVNQATGILGYDRSGRFTQTNRSLSQWKTFTKQEAHSNISSTITVASNLDFEYNATSSPITISLPYNYIDVKGARYNRTIILAPFTSAVLIKNGDSNNHR